jgi:pilus assembly protein CpaF
MRISEIAGIEGDSVMMQDLFEFKRTGVAADGTAVGQFRSSGIRSMYTDRVATTGQRIEPPLNIYR